MIEQYIEQRGDFLLSCESVDELTTYLRQNAWINVDEEVVGVKIAGDGNMNCTLRVRTNQRSFIVKQSREWVEKYPDIPAPEHRRLGEIEFYELVAKDSAVATMMPGLLNVDRINRVAQFTDLGEAADYSSVYVEPDLVTKILPELCRWLRQLHDIEFVVSERARLSNRDMRDLNHEYLYHFPLSNTNEFNLDEFTPGLQVVGDTLKNNTEYVDAIARLGKIYLGEAEDDDLPTALLHGDFFPGAWLRGSGVSFYVIDPEFCFFGPREYDVGVLIGHLHLANVAQAVIDSVMEHYAGSTTGAALDVALVYSFAGMEIMRRIMGVAQLPLEASLARKTRLLEVSEKLVLDWWRLVKNRAG